MSHAAKPTVRHVDGHALSHLHNFRTRTTSLAPIVTPPIIINHSSSSSSSIGGKNNSDDYNREQYILVPNSQRIVVRSAHHGKKICDLVVVDPTRSEEEEEEEEEEESNGVVVDRGNDADIIRAVTLAWLPRPSPPTTTLEDDGDQRANTGEWIILAGCKNGMVHEWSVSDLSHSFNDDDSVVASSATTSKDQSTKHCYGRASRRSFQLVTHPKTSSSSSGNKASKMKTALEVIHLTCPSSSSTTTTTEEHSFFSDGKVLLYGLVTKTTISSDDTTESSSSSTWLIRMEIPPFAVPSQSSTTKTLSSASTPRHQHQQRQLLPIKSLLAVKEVPSKGYNEGTRQDKFVCLKTNDSIFGFLASYRQEQRQRHDQSMLLEYKVGMEREDSTRGHVFVVMCSSRGLAIYRDSLATNDDIVDENSNHQRRSLEPSAPPSTKLVHFAKIMKSSNPREDKITSLAMSPGANDLALGRGCGQIDILDNVFDNVAAFLDRRKQFIVEKKKRKETNGAAAMEVGESDLLQRLWQHHPEEVTIRRTVHWHAHPVRTLAFVSSSSSGRQQSCDSNAIANPMSLLSGGEESVLVTWQLDRNFHRPSHFVARVGRGGIAHMVTCRSSGKIILFCSDNSIQCFDGSTYERDWAEFGLAAMALYGDEEESAAGDDGRRLDERSPIIMVKDPITNIPMLTNLPGAPGMIHWYDPSLASVVGTLEVAPYNRVSRREPSDPHVPEPTVTHLAVGRRGKDMITVDTVWTENTTVGVARDLIGPKGNITRMNVITCIKFWTHVESPTKLGKSSDYQRKRRNGDVPMSYELVASMSAPHGRDGMVCALAMAPNGNIACTLSREEDAFRIWAKKTNGSPPSAGGTGERTTVWKCLYVVKTPSGFANMLVQSVISSSVGQQLVAFSSDGTVLSVSYGPCVTLWDHSNVTLLTSISSVESVTLPGSLSENIETVNFLTGNDDAMLLTTAHQIRIISPFGGVKSYLGDDEWLFCADSIGKDAIVLGNDAFVSAISLLQRGEGIRDTGGHFAVSITLKDRSKSIVSIVDRDTGAVAMLAGSDTPIRWDVDGEVQSLYVEKHLGSVIQLLAVMKDCQMLALNCGTEARLKRKGLGESQYAGVRMNRSQAPILKLGNKIVDAEKFIKKRKVSIGVPQRNYSGFEFPVLSGKFTSAFIARGLGKSSN